MSSFKSIRYTEMMPSEVLHSFSKAHNTGEFVGFSAEDKFWGRYQENRFLLPHISIVRTTTELNDNFRVGIKDHTLDKVINICLSLDGFTQVTFGKKEFSASLNTGKHHIVYAPVEDYTMLVKRKMDNVHIAIDLNYYRDLLNSPEAWSDKLRRQLEGETPVYHGEFYLTIPMRRIVWDILQSPVSGHLRNLIIEGKVLELIALQLNSFYGVKETGREKTTNKDTDIFYAIREYLHNTFSEEHSLKSLARNFGLNEFKLKSGFKEFFGKPVFEYIHDLKMEHARQLLQDAGLYVNEVSLKVGYKNPNHFSTAFKKKFGLSPASLR